MRRREFIARVGVAAASVTGVAALLQWLSSAAAGAMAAAASIFDRIRGLPLEVTPVGTFFSISKNSAGRDPRLEPGRWSLEITGLVGKPLRLTYDQLKAMRAVERYHTLECINNPVGGDLIGNAHWRGVRFSDLVVLAGGVSPEATRFAVRCADGYTEGLPVAEAMHPDTLLALEMNGRPLTGEHGFPARLLVPGLYGMKNVKWIVRAEAVKSQFTGYWQASGWSDEAVVKTSSSFRLPKGSPVGPGPVDLGGIAYGGDRGIREIEVSADGGRTWFAAEVKRALGDHTWVLWAASWKPPRPGEYTLRVRAKDGAGILQTAQETPPFPDGSSGYHTMRLRVRG